MSQSFLPAELSGVIRGGIVLLPHVYVRVYACICERCGLFEIIIFMQLDSPIRIGSLIEGSPLTEQKNIITCRK